MKKKISIVGAGGLGREVAALIRALPQEFDLAGFYDDTIPAGTTIMGLRVLGTINQLASTSSAIQVVVAIGNPQVKQKIVSSLPHSIHYPVIIHPSVILGDHSTIRLGQGTILTAGVKLTVDIELGSHVLVNLNSTVGHNVRIGDFSSVMPGVNLAGGITVGERVLIGSGANVINRITIGSDARIGSGAVVRTNIAPNTTAVGVPAKITK